MTADYTNLPMTLTPPKPERLWRKVASAMSRIPFAEDLVAAYYCALDSQTPTYVRAVLFGAVAYFILPTDFLPDVILGLGFTDDASVIAAALAGVGSYMRPEHRAAARARLEALRNPN